MAVVDYGRDALDFIEGLEFSQDRRKCDGRTRDGVFALRL